MVTVAGDEELGSQRVAEAQSQKGQPGTLTTTIEHLLLIFAEGLPTRRPVKVTVGRQAIR